MKRVIKSSESIAKTFRFYFTGGNRKLIEAPNIYEALSYVCFELDCSAEDIYKIEEVKE